jgi:hypothetical protein
MEGPGTLYDSDTVTFHVSGTWNEICIVVLVQHLMKFQVEQETSVVGARVLSILAVVVAGFGYCIFRYFVDGKGIPIVRQV